MAVVKKHKLQIKPSEKVLRIGIEIGLSYSTPPSTLRKRNKRVLNSKLNVLRKEEKV